jgi:hypothetical protein
MMRPIRQEVKSILRPLLIVCMMVAFFWAQIAFLKSEGASLIIEEFARSSHYEHNNNPDSFKYEILIVDNDKKEKKDHHEKEGDNMVNYPNDPETHQPPLCTREQIRRGQWKTFERLQAPYTSTDDWERTCSKNEDTTRPYQDSEWAVSSEDCAFHSFNATRLCEILENRTIAFLGDSITFQQYNSLKYLTGAENVIRFASKCFSRTCPNKSSKLYWMRDNQATSKYWSNMIRQVDPEIIVLNRGAHHTSNEILRHELNDTLHTALRWQEDCDQRNRNCVLMWRTTAPGFPNCQQIPGPLNNASAAEEMIANTSWYMEYEVRKRFHWMEFATQNQLVEELIQDFRQNKKLRISFLDFYDLAILRPDHHIDDKDCLHWCLPGPMDAANQLLLHQLEVAKRQQEDRRRMIS